MEVFITVGLILFVLFVSLSYFGRHYLYGVKEGIKAHRRGEVRVAPRGARGRVYAKKESSGPTMPTRTEPKATIHMKIMRKDGSVEYREVPAQVTFIPDKE